MQNVPKILPPSLCIKSWYHNKFHDFLNSFVVNEILKRFVLTVQSMVCEQDLRNLLCLRHQIELLNMNIIFLSIILPYSKYFQFNPKNSINEIKLLNIAKITRNIPDFNKEYNTLYMYSRKNWEHWINFFFTSLLYAEWLSCAFWKTHGK